jgi:nicotinamide mononucleotide transporter
MRLSPQFILLALLTLCTAALAGVMAVRGAASWLEAVSFVTGALCVWLTVKESVWNFPISLLNVSTLALVFLRAHLFSDASLQVVYFILTLIGWYLWLYGGEKHSALHITRSPLREYTLLLLAVAGLTLVLWQTMHYLGGSASFFDALTTAISLGAQWLLNKKRLENWHLWILADIIYVPLYTYKALYLTALLYALFLIMATIGLFQWRATFHRSRQISRPEPLLTEAAS